MVRLLLLLGVGAVIAAATADAAPQGGWSMVTSLNGEWVLAIDPHNVGRQERWFDRRLAEARPTRVPWIIQDAFPGYHGVAWYQREFTLAAPPLPPGNRQLLRFWAVDYLAEVWLNGQRLGSHEGGETPFVLAATPALRTTGPNLLTVRVLNPTTEPIDGMVLRETPARNKVVPYGAGNSYNHGGIVDDVELLQAPAVRLADLCLLPEPESGTIRVRLELDSVLPAPATRRLEVTVAPAASGTALAQVSESREVPAGASVAELALRLAQPHRWDLHDPYLYRVTARLTDVAGGGTDELSARCGFRDFRFERGAFRLNGRRLLLKCSHTGNHFPVGQQLPPDPDMARRDLLNVKVMGFNAIRFISGVATRAQLDLCDELGLLVYEEHYGSWCLADSPQMTARFDRSLGEMIRRDRNHPSVAMWGLLNETNDGAVFRHAVASLPLVRALDDSRLVFLNSGRFDQNTSSTLAGLRLWRTTDGPDPSVTHNGTAQPLTGLGVTWQPGQLALHPGPRGEYGVLRWTAPAAGTVEVAARFSSIAERATTDVHVLHQGHPLYDGQLNLGGAPGQAAYAGQVAVQAGDALDFVVGWGNGHHGGDTTALALTLRSAAGSSDPAAEFRVGQQPNGPWRYGWLAPGATPDSASFQPFALSTTLGDENGIGSLSNPGSAVWENVLNDQHPYQRVPHTAAVVQFLRQVSAARQPVFLSEYGVGSAVDLCRATRWYEQLGKTGAEDAVFYRAKLDAFLADYQRWQLADCFARPEDFFTASHRSMAADRLYGLNALRANPHVVAQSLTGTVDQGMAGEGLFTTFRELKPGTVDALFDAMAPLRLCLFAEPVQLYRGGQVHLEAVLANEDVLPPGDYPVRLTVTGPAATRALDRTVTVTVPPARDGQEPPLALPCFALDLPLAGPAGEYHFQATLERGGAATGGEARCFVSDPATMPAVTAEVTLWGEDAALAKWLAAHQLRTRPVDATGAGRRELLLVGRQGPVDTAAWRDLAERVARGSSVVFLAPEALRRGDEPLGWLPLAKRGRLAAAAGWLYHKDEWAKQHPIFAGLPAGGLMDHLYYRELIPDVVFSDQDPPAEAVAGACNASFDYSSGLLTAVYPLGAGRVVLNALLIAPNLETSPVAERLLRNLLNYAARDLDAPPAALPADFARQLQAWGYLP